MYGMMTDQTMQSADANLPILINQSPAISDSVKFIEWSGMRIRIFGSEENTRFHAADMAKSLGYSNTNKAISDNVLNHDKCLGSEFNKQNPSLKLNQYEKHAIFINKRGVCSLLSASKMPNKTGLIELLGATYGLTYDIIARLGKEQEYIGSIITSFAYCNPIRQFKVGPYFIDLYFQVENIAIECDEFNHTRYDQNAESVRQEFITKTIGCRFIRFNPDAANFSIFGVINDIGLEILQHHRK